LACHLRAHVLFLGDHQRRPVRASGNYLLTLFCQPEISWREGAAWSEVNSHLQQVAEAEVRRGERPFIIPPGASEGAGVLGSVEMGLEILASLRGCDPNRLSIVAAAGSGGTCLGLKLACEKLQWPCRVFAIAIGENAEAIRRRQRQMREAWSHRAGGVAEDNGGLIVTEVGLGGGYDNPQPDEIATMREAAARYGLLFDLNYMAKTYLGLKRLIASGVIERGTTVVLVHSGGQIGIFDENPRLSEELLRMNES
jgi:1-aminocyclopropane-1-carboxylate deaminase/D-cysteine desulfhydrase-like pyridoxal-dependent ACC family enzyme